MAQTTTIPSNIYTLEHLYQDLGRLSPMLRRMPAMYYSENTLGPVLGVRPTEQRIQMIAQAADQSEEVALPQGMPMVAIRPTGFVTAGDRPEPLLHFPEPYRLTNEKHQQHWAALPKQAMRLVSRQQDSPNGGAFLLPRVGKSVGAYFLVIASDGMGAASTLWEHVSVTILGEERCPTWAEMCYVKDLFWPQQATVLQFHPSADQYVNAHPTCLHLWRSLAQSAPLPPPALLG